MVSLCTGTGLNALNMSSAVTVAILVKTVDEMILIEQIHSNNSKNLFFKS